MGIHIQAVGLMRISIFSLGLLWMCSGCSDKDNMEPFCEISIAVKTDEFYRGCTLPVSVKAGEGTNGENQVQLFINDMDMGLVPTSPYKYYWNTAGQPAGDHSIKAIYRLAENVTVVDEQIINLLAVSVSCPAEVIDIDGNEYPVVKIGNQCWMQENLKTTHYPDGEPLISGIDSLEAYLLNSNGAPQNTLTGWYFTYGLDSNNADSYGYLYTWATAMKGNRAADESTGPIQGLCPEGWHIPVVDEWQALIDFVGGVDIAANKLKDASPLYWTDNLMATDNTSGFTALPGGCFVPNSSFLDIELAGYFWTATETIPNHAYHIYLKNSDSKSFILGHQDSKRFGYSLRCVKD